MSTGDQLFGAVRASPEDEALRLVYADWLEEQGDPRAEFIRVQCALAKLPPEAPERVPLEMREGELLRLHIDQFRPPRLTGVDWGGFYLGFVDRCRFASPRDFVAKAAEAFELAPLRTIRIMKTRLPEDAQAQFAAMVQSFKPLERLTEFDPGWLDPPAIRDALWSSPHFTGLRRIRQTSTFATDDNPLLYILSGPPMPQLTELTFEQMGLTDESLAAFAQSPRFPALETLNLSGSRRLQNVGVLGSLRAELRALNLAGVTIPPDQVEELLLGGPATARLEELNLSSTQLGSAGLRILSRAPCRNTLQKLRLVSLDAARAGAGLVVMALAAWPALEELTLDKNELGAAGVAQPLAAAAMPKLRRLSLPSCDLRDDCATALAGSVPRPLTELDLSHNRIGLAGISALADSGLFRELRTLSLVGNPLGPEGAKALANARSLEQLQELNLHLSDIGEHDVDALRALHGRFPFWKG